jgi:small subunit ribosomal protein S17
MMAEGQTQAQETSERELRRVDQGVVIADNRDKTIKVKVEYMVKHPRYNKYLRKQITHHVHDEKNEAKMGDTVEIMETRPISKTKTWRMIRVVKKAEV